MRTHQSEAVARRLLLSLDKDWEEAAHPRDPWGQFAPTEGRRVAEALMEPPAEAPKGHPQKAVRCNPETMRAASSLISAEYLKQVKAHGWLGGGKGGEDYKEESWWVEFKDGTKAVYKPTATSFLQQNIDQGMENKDTVLDLDVNQSAREVAAFRLSRAIGFDIVPPVERVVFHPNDFDNPKARRKMATQGGGHAMGWIDGEEADKDEDRLDRDLAEGHPDLHRLAALDFIIGILDRHEGNAMRGDDGRYYAVDNGLSWSRDQESGMYHSFAHRGLVGAEIPEEVRQEIRSLTKEALAGIMKEGGFKEPDILGAQARLAVLREARRWGKESRMLDAAEDVYFQHGGRRRSGYIF